MMIFKNPETLDHCRFTTNFHRPVNGHVEYLMSGFEYFSGGFAQAVGTQTKHKVDQHTTRRALFDTSISFLKCPFYSTTKFTKP